MKVKELIEELKNFDPMLPVTDNDGSEFMIVRLEQFEYDVQGPDNMDVSTKMEDCVVIK